MREGASIGANCVLGKDVYVDSDVVIGDNCKLENGVSVFQPAVLEDGVFLGPGVILTNDRVPRAVNPDGSAKRSGNWAPAGAVIRYGAALGAGSIVLPGVTVERWALVGAGAVVVSDVPAHGLVVGNPGRLIGYVCACGSRLDGPGRPEDMRCSACSREQSA
ncbi:MAG TPA: acyltransferase [Actinomycetota bacterium]|nr:acyltransferase [Actinomycetota bacterium]